MEKGTRRKHTAIFKAKVALAAMAGEKTLAELSLVAYLNFKAKLGSSMQQILRLLQLNLFVRRDLIELFRPPAVQVVDSPQRLLWENL